MSITKEEIEYLRNKRVFYDTTRNTLMVFLFTTVMAILGVAIGADLTYLGSFLCLVPFLLIYPFTARVVYYRLADAHISSFLTVFAPESTQFQQSAREVPESIWRGMKGCGYPLVAFLVNHEMLFLGIACTAVFLVKHFLVVDIEKCCCLIEVAIVIISMMLNVPVFVLMHSTYHYGPLKQEYVDAWMQLKLKDENTNT